jgi:HK97 family phage prohead protease
MDKKPADNEFERRAFVMDALKIEARADAKETRRIVGHASVFNRDADIGGWFLERVAPGAFKRAIREDDVRALFNHDSNIVLGRNKAGTLKLAEDDVGLAIDIDPPDTQWARDLMVSIERGDINQMSIGFRVLKQEWDETGEVAKRTLLEVELFDVSPVTFPAFVETDVGLRSLAAYRKTQSPKGLTAPGPDLRALIQRSRDRGNFLK